MDNWFKSKWFVRAIALVFALLLYVVVYTENDASDKDYSFFGNTSDTQTIEQYPVKVRIDGERYVVSGVPESVAVTVEGSNSAVTRAVKQQNFDVFVDLRGLGKGEHTVEIEYENADGLTVYIEPKTIDVIIEERSSQEYEVNVDFTNVAQLPEGYELGDFEVNPKTVTITSSKTVIDKISIVKVFVNVAGLTESINNREVPVKVYDSQGNELRVRIEPENVVVSATINNPSKQVPVSVATKGELPTGYTLSSMKANMEEVEVFATSNVLKGIEKIETEEINLADVQQSGVIKTKLKLPKGAVVKNVGDVEVMIELEQTRKVDGISLKVDNLANGKSVSFINPDNPKMDITVSGKAQDVGKLTANDFKASIDVAGLDVGRHRVPVQINGPDNITIDGEYDDVTIEISE
ncbi:MULTISPECIES: CdaR family protein [unclassified Virgibacillus]|uniref:CdaR family protein n=1 Tax=unclassified Virgibacillus TaxID=2620237 RepID=UPI0024DEC29D|nr:CdaR family protein [Virgibacillus sp. LDC-1]